MASLDKSLDEIISSNKKPVVRSKKAPAPKAPKVAKVSKKQVARNNISKASVPKTPGSSDYIDPSYATKVIVYNLPHDIKQNAVKEFFQSQVGGVKSIALSYNEKGLSKGIATVVFRDNSHATTAVKKYNGAPIDGGANKLRLEMIFDPTKKPLISRISANPVVEKPRKLNVQPIQTANKKKGPKANSKPAAAKPAAAKAGPKGGKKVRKPKKTVEELDQEMADYFDNKN